MEQQLAKEKKKTKKLSINNAKINSQLEEI
jgi:hypothetical protein